VHQKYIGQGIYVGSSEKYKKTTFELSLFSGRMPFFFIQANSSRWEMDGSGRSRRWWITRVGGVISSYLGQ
jgi:hypothetical protein